MMAPLRRMRLAGALDDRLYFAQVREDPMLELEVLAPGPDDTIVCVSSGGCTALSLLAAGAGRVVAVDLNATQHHAVELKVAAILGLPWEEALGFLGARPAPGWARRRDYALLRGGLSDGARRWWDARGPLVEGGLLAAGVTEAFIRQVVRVLRWGVVGRRGIARLLACESVAAQQEVFAWHWDSWRWRALFTLLLGPSAFRRTYDPAFFAHLEQPSFAAHFRARASYTMTQLPVRDNYFLHHVLHGDYGPCRPQGLPPYLRADARARLVAARDALTLVDAPMTAYLATLPEASVQGFVLSNICKWLSPDGQAALFAEVARTAAPGARVVFRNFVGWTEVPARWRARIVEDRAWGETLMATDRSIVQRRIAPCRVVAAGPS